MRQVADEPAHGPGKFFDQRRGRDDLMGARQAGLLVDIDYLELAAAFQFGLAQLTDMQDGLAGPGRGPGHEQPQDVLARGPGGQGRSKDLFCTAGIGFLQDVILG